MRAASAVPAAVLHAAPVTALLHSRRPQSLRAEAFAIVWLKHSRNVRMHRTVRICLARIARRTSRDKQAEYRRGTVCSTIVYHGPVDGAAPFLASLRLVRPPKKDLAAFLVEATTPAGVPTSCVHPEMILDAQTFAWRQVGAFKCIC